MRRPLYFVLACLGAGLIAATARGQQADITFQLSSSFEVARSPQFLAVADFNGDGLPDLVASSPESRKVTVLISDRTGNGFSAIVSAGPYGTSMRQVAAGDLDQDGIPDVAVTDYYHNQVLVMLGNGDGTLRTPSLFATGSRPYGVTIGEFNGLPGNDMAVSNSGVNNVSVFFNRGNGRGSFGTPSTFPTSKKPGLMLTADLTDDGLDDFVALNTGNLGANDVTELVSNGVGGFQSRGNFVVGDGANQMTAGDFNNDGILDVAVVNGRSSSSHVFSSAFVVLLGDGAGFFTRSVATQIDCPTTGNLTACLPRAIAAGDFDQDGNVDLAIGIDITSDVVIFTGNGNGTFDRVGSPIPTLGRPIFLVADDFDGDGLPDLAVAEVSGVASLGNIQLLHNTTQPLLPTAVPTNTNGPSPTPTPSTTGSPGQSPLVGTPTQVPAAVTPTRITGDTCTSPPNDCLSGFCVDGRCCNTACNGSNEICDDPDFLGACITPRALPPTLAPTRTPGGGGGQGDFVVSRSGGCSVGNGGGSLPGQLAIVLVPALWWLRRRVIFARVRSQAHRRVR